MYVIHSLSIDTDIKEIKLNNARYLPLKQILTHMEMGTMFELKRLNLLQVVELSF